MQTGRLYFFKSSRAPKHVIRVRVEHLELLLLLFHVTDNKIKMLEKVAFFM